MKTSMTVVLLSLSVGAYSAPVKTCNTIYPVPGETVLTEIKIFEAAGVLKARLTQTVDGEINSYEDSATIGDYPVRGGLTEETEGQDLNPAEALVVQAMTLENDPVFEGKISSGVALKKVRAAKVYTIGEPTNMGSSAIVEARDARGKALGSYYGGLLVSPCR